MTKLKKLKIAIFFILLMSINGCSDLLISDNKERIGAICNDGTKTDATGRGACSYHGGVKEWIYK